MSPGTLLKVNLCYSDIGENYIVLSISKNCIEKLGQYDVMILLSEELADGKKNTFDTLKVLTTRGVGWVWKDEVKVIK